MLLDRQYEVIAKQALYPFAPIFNIGAVIDIRGPLDEQRMFDADQAVKRDPALRSALSMRGYEPEIVTLAEDTSPLKILDLSCNDDPFTSAFVCIEQSLQQMFAFEGKTPLMQHTLIRLANDHHLMVGVYHHLAYDGWATSLIYQHLAAYYNDFTRFNSVRNLSPLSYQEQISAEMNYKHSASYMADHSYWQARLSGYDTMLFAQGCRDVAAKRYSFTLDIHYREKLQELALDSGGTLFQVLAGITAIFLFQLFGTDDVVIGLPVLNRRTARAKQTFGFFANVLPFRLQRQINDTFKTLLKNIIILLKEDYRHQRFPANQILKGGTSYEATLSYEKHDYSAIFEGTDT